MKFVSTGRKRAKEHRLKARELREALVDQAVGATRFVINQPSLCLQSSVLLSRILAEVLPDSRHTLRLGSLQVYPGESQNAEGIAFDPRGPDGVDGGFHAWLEDAHGELIDPTILLTLHARGYDVEPDAYLLGLGREFRRDGLLFLYEELPQLELTGVEQSEPHLQRLLLGAMGGMAPPPGTVYLDVTWREST